MVACEGGKEDSIFYEAKHSGSKLQLLDTSMDSVDLAFQDKWNQPPGGYQGFHGGTDCGFPETRPTSEQVVHKERLT